MTAFGGFQEDEGYRDFLVPPRRAGPGWLQYLLIASLLILASNYDPEAGLHGGFQGEEWNENKRESIGQIGEGGPVRGVALLLLSGVALFYFSRPARFERSNRRWGLRALVAFAAIAAASIAWSDDPLVSVKRSGAVCVGVLLAMALARRWTWSELMTLALITTGIVTFGGLLIAIGTGEFRPWEGGYRFAPMSHPNPTAQDCVLLVMAAAGLAIAGPRRRLLIAICVVAGVCMFLTRSRTSVLSFLVAGAVVVFMARPKRELVLGLLLAGIAIAAIAVFVPDLRAVFTGTATMGRQDVSGADVSTFTGRTYIWQVAYTFFQERPLQGFGFGGFWIPQRIDIFAAQLGWVFFHAHSGYVDAALGLGIIGLILFVSLLGISWIESVGEWRQERTAGPLYVVGLMTFTAVCSVAETFFPLANLPSFFVMMAVARLTFDDPAPDVEAAVPELADESADSPRLVHASALGAGVGAGWSRSG